MNNRRAFTLIELLVVIAIIAMLLAIMVPVLSKAKEQVRTIMCRSNLKQYGLCVRMYLDDNDYRFPTTTRWLKGAGSGAAAYLREGQQPDGVFWPYLSSFDIHLCPSFLSANKGAANAPGDLDIIRGGYVMNSYLGNNGNVWNNWLGPGVKCVTKESEVSRSSIFTFSEENFWTIPGYSNWPMNDLHFTVGDASRQIDNFATLHNPPGKSRDMGPLTGLNAGSANAAYLDGSVEYIPRAKTADQLDKNFWRAWPKAARR